MSIIEAFIIRNAGGRLRSSIKDLIFLDTMTQEQVLRHVIVIHHTGTSPSPPLPLSLPLRSNKAPYLDCGYTHATDEFLKTTLKAKNPALEKEIEDLYFGTYGSGDWQRLEESVREDLRFLRKQPLIRQEAKDCSKGYVYDIKTGKLHAVVDED